MEEAEPPPARPTPPVVPEPPVSVPLPPLPEPRTDAVDLVDEDDAPPAAAAAEEEQQEEQQVGVEEEEQPFSGVDDSPSQTWSDWVNHSKATLQSGSKRALLTIDKKQTTFVDAAKGRWKHIRHADETMVNDHEHHVLRAIQATNSLRKRLSVGGILSMTDVKTKQLNLWKVQVKRMQKDSMAFYWDFLLYVPLFTFTLFLVSHFPDTTSTLKQQEIFQTLMLADEMEDPSEDYAKNAYGPEAVEDVWTWAENVLLGNVYEDEEPTEDACGRPLEDDDGLPLPPPPPVSDDTQLIFDHSTLVGSIEVRSVKSAPDPECGGGPIADAWAHLLNIYPDITMHGETKPLSEIECYSLWTSQDEEIASFGGSLPTFGSTAWCGVESNCGEAVPQHGDHIGYDPSGEAVIFGEGPYGLGGSWQAHATSDWCNGRLRCPYQPHTFETKVKGSVTFSESMTGNVVDYGTEGYKVDLPTNRRAALDVLHAMASERGGFVDRSTQAVIFMINTYNINEGTLTMLQVTFNLDITGHIEMFYRLQTVLPSRDFFYCDTGVKVLVLLLWYIWTGILVFDEVKKMMLYGIKQHLRDGWSRMEFVFFALFLNLNTNLLRFHLTSLRIEDAVLEAQTASTSDLDWLHPEQEALMASATNSSAQIPLGSTPFVDLTDLRGEFRDLQTGLAFYSALSALRFFKYFRFSLRLNLLWRVVDLAVFQLMNFLMIIVVLALSFSFLSVTNFGPSVRGFHNVPSSMMSMIQMSTGTVEWAGYDEMKRAAPVLAPVFIVLYVLIFIIVVINMFVAILMDAYDVARDEMIRGKKQERELNAASTANAFHHDIKTNYTLTDVLLLLFRLFRPHLAVTISLIHGDHEANIHEGVNVRLQYAGVCTAKSGPTRTFQHQDRVDMYKQRQDIVTDLRIAPMHSLELRSAQFIAHLRSGDKLELRDAVADQGNLHVINAKFALEYCERESLKYRTSMDDDASTSSGSGSITSFWEHHDSLAVFRVIQVQSWESWKHPDTLPVKLPERSVLTIPLLLQMKLWWRSGFLLKTLGDSVHGSSLSTYFAKACRYVMSLPSRFWQRQFNPRTNHLIEKYLAMLRLNAMEQVENPNNLVEVQAVFSGHPVPFKNFRAHLLYWLEMTYGTKFAAKTSKALHQKDIEAYLIRKYPEAIEEIGSAGTPHHPSSLAAHMAGQDVLRPTDENPAIEQVHRAADNLAADVGSVDVALKSLFEEMHSQLDHR